MKLLTKDTDYAVRALIVLALDKKKFVSARKISDTQDIPYQYLRQILKKLISSKLIDSREGIGGGVQLVADPAGITILELINIFQGELELSDCMFKKQECPKRGSCVLRPEIKRIEETVCTEFQKITIKDLLKKLGG
ncbi:MAG: Rrf2 family transcriptional regulator [bacterium]|nr:Rrf2 family transcriptional regulator [bacterium]